jgi:phage gp36-like protein
MALYVTQAQLESRFRKQDIAQLASDTSSSSVTEAQADVLLADTTVTARITSARTDASNDVDLYMNGRADMTDSTNQSGVLRIAAALTMCYLKKRKHGLNPQLQAEFDMEYRKLKAMQGRDLILRTDDESPEIETSGRTWDLDRVADSVALANF